MIENPINDVKIYDFWLYVIAAAMTELGIKNHEIVWMLDDFLFRYGIGDFFFLFQSFVLEFYYRTVVFDIVDLTILF